MPPKARRPLAIFLAAAVLAILFYRFGIILPDQVLPPAATTAGKSSVETASSREPQSPIASGDGTGAPGDAMQGGVGSGASGGEASGGGLAGESGGAEAPGGSSHAIVVGSDEVAAEPESPAMPAPATEAPAASVTLPPPPPPIAAELKPSVVRYPALTTQRDQVTPDQTLWVEFAIAEMPVDDAGQVKAGPGAVSSAAGGVTLPPGKLDFTVSLTAKGFDVLEGGDRQDFYMGPTGDSDRVRFVLKPKAGLSVPRTETISASLWRRGAFVAEITRQVQVATGIMSADASGLPSAEGSRPVSFVAILVSSDGSASLVQPHR